MDYLLIDGKNLLFRAGYASRHLQTADGRHSGAIHGFIKMLCRVRTQYPCAEIVILWEATGQKTYRHKLFPEYKNRHKPGEGPDPYTQALHAQIEPIRDFCRVVGMRWVESSGLEADDLAGLLATYLAGLETVNKVILMSGDRDWWQLASIRGVQVLCEQGLDRETETILTDARVIATFGCKAKELVRFRPFIGDTSDKIPPVRPRFLKKHALQLTAAGVDPRKPLDRQPQSIRTYKDIGAVWANYERNYKLMRIARQPEDCGMVDEEFQRILSVVLDERPEKGSPKDLRLLLGDWELSDAMGRREFLMKLSIPQDQFTVAF